MGFGSRIGISSAFGDDDESKKEESVNGNLEHKNFYFLKSNLFFVFFKREQPVRLTLLGITFFL